MNTNMNTKRQDPQIGQALVALLVFTLVTITLATASIAIVLLNSRRAQTVEQGQIALTIAENGAENALIRLLRDQNYTGETLTQSEGDAIVVVTTGTVKTILSEARSRGFTRKIEVVVDTTNHELNIQSWKQTY